MGLGHHALLLLLAAAGGLDHTHPPTQDGILDRRKEGVLAENLEKVAGTTEAKLCTTNLHVCIQKNSIGGVGWKKSDVFQYFSKYTQKILGRGN